MQATTLGWIEGTHAIESEMGRYWGDGAQGVVTCLGAGEDRGGPLSPDHGAEARGSLYLFSWAERSVTFDVAS